VSLLYVLSGNPVGIDCEDVVDSELWYRLARSYPSADYQKPHLDPGTVRPRRTPRLKHQSESDTTTDLLW
jgi:hypothetical protein